MEDLYLRDIYIYPIKSLGGIRVQQAEVQDRGLQYDRRWMLTDENGKFLSQRKIPEMALLQVTIGLGGLTVSHKNSLMKPLTIPFRENSGKELVVTIWDDKCTALEVSSLANNWFSLALGVPTRLVYMPDTTKRWVDKNYAENNEIVSFADGYPILVIAQASLDDLNRRLQKPLPMNRFRPNLVLRGGFAFIEDIIKSFALGNLLFRAVEPCSRCVLTNIDQAEGIKGVEPLRTLASFRTFNNKILFGQNLVHSGTGTIKVGDILKVF